MQVFDKLRSIPSINSSDLDRGSRSSWDNHGERSKDRRQKISYNITRIHLVEHLKYKDARAVTN